jgi:hypothetical protein
MTIVTTVIAHESGTKAIRCVIILGMMYVFRQKDYTSFLFPCRTMWMTGRLVQYQGGLYSKHAGGEI